MLACGILMHHMLTYCCGCYLSFVEEMSVHWAYGSGEQGTPKLSALCEILFYSSVG